MGAVPRGGGRLGGGRGRRGGGPGFSRVPELVRRLAPRPEGRRRGVLLRERRGAVRAQAQAEVGRDRQGAIPRSGRAPRFDAFDKHKLIKMV